jgi:hypothetical protein
MKSYPIFGYTKKHARQHGLEIPKSLILLKKIGLSTQNRFALSTTTILFLKKKIRRQDKYP